MSSRWERYRITALIVVVSMGIGITLAIAGETMGLLETVGISLMFFGWFVVAPLYHFWWSHRSSSPITDGSRRQGRSTDRSRLSVPSTDEGADDDPLAILQRRYADGELSEAEFERRLEHLLGVEGLDLDRLADAARDRSADRDRDRDLEYE